MVATLLSLMRTNTLRPSRRNATVTIAATTNVRMAARTGRGGSNDQSAAKVVQKAIPLTITDVARFRDPTIDGWVVVLRVCRNGTEAAANS